jgi:hypothetical protein
MGGSEVLSDDPTARFHVGVGTALGILTAQGKIDQYGVLGGEDVLVTVTRFAGPWTVDSIVTGPQIRNAVDPVRLGVDVVSDLVRRIDASEVPDAGD